APPVAATATPEPDPIPAAAPASAAPPKASAPDTPAPVSSASEPSAPAPAPAAPEAKAKRPHAAGSDAAEPETGAPEAADTPPSETPAPAPAPKPALETTHADTEDAAALRPGAADTGSGTQQETDSPRPAPARLAVPTSAEAGAVAAPSIAPHAEDKTPPPAFTSIRASRSDDGPSTTPTLRAPGRDALPSVGRLTPQGLGTKADGDGSTAAAADTAKPADIAASRSEATASFERRADDHRKTQAHRQETATAAKPSVLGGFFSRRKPRHEPPPIAAPVSEPVAETPKPAVAASTRIKARADSTDTSPPKPVLTSALARLGGGRSRAAAAAGPSPEDMERERMTVFGARQSQARVGGKPRFLGLMLTAVLLIFLAGVAAWASVFLDDGLARFFRPDTSPDVQVAEEALPSPDPTPEAAPEEPPVELAALDPAPETAVPDPAEPLAEPERPRALSPEEAEATYAATGIWQRAPGAPSEPAQGGLDDLYVASIDTEVQQFDAVALPEAARSGDPSYVSPPVPAPAGTVFDIDDRGLVRAVATGALNADGVLIYAGLPPAVPPGRPVPGSPDAPVTEETRAEQDRLQGFRPAARPDGIVERNERSLLQGVSRAELAQLRPTIRPEVAKLAEEADVTATAQAIDTSPKPLRRPRDIERIVAEARARAASTPEPEPEVQVASAAAVAPRAVQPSIPSTANVAQRATVRGALDMRRISLIGVYGKPAARRALVRLPNGRYQKVQVGDRIDGGRVAAIGDSDLRYTKGGRSATLSMP
ncbi:hypothetical protein, partial [Thalassococcus profundi]|uniref:hypothetical protein n=1 Tax=Thalassococcus profundi TaxID=2282382 RepID=UPI001F261550